MMDKKILATTAPLTAIGRFIQRSDARQAFEVRNIKDRLLKNFSSAYIDQ